MFSLPVYYIPMPINKDGNGPAEEHETVNILHEVWDAECVVVCVSHTEEMARWVADRINKAGVD